MLNNLRYGLIQKAGIVVVVVVVVVVFAGIVTIWMLQRNVRNEDNNAAPKETRDKEYTVNEIRNTVRWILLEGLQQIDLLLKLAAESTYTTTIVIETAETPATDGQGGIRRKFAITALGILRSERGMEVLKKILRDTSEDITARSRAADALGSSGLPEVIPVLREVALSDQNPVIREGAVIAMGFTKQVSAIAVLEEVLKLEPEEFVREHARKAIERLRE